MLSSSMYFSILLIDSRPMFCVISTGGYGFGHAKKELMDLILKNFSKERERFNYFICNPDEVEQILQIGAKKAKVTANSVLDRVRKKLGY